MLAATEKLMFTLHTEDIAAVCVFVSYFCVGQSPLAVCVIFFLSSSKGRVDRQSVASLLAFANPEKMGEKTNPVIVIIIGLVIFWKLRSDHLERVNE